MAELCSQPQFLQVVLKESAEAADCAILLCPSAVASVWEGRGKTPMRKPPLPSSASLHLPGDHLSVSTNVDLCCI